MTLCSSIRVLWNNGRICIWTSPQPAGYKDQCIKICLFICFSLLWEHGMRRDFEGEVMARCQFSCHMHTPWKIFTMSICFNKHSLFIGLWLLKQYYSKMCLHMSLLVIGGHWKARSFLPQQKYVWGIETRESLGRSEALWELRIRAISLLYYPWG